MDNKKHKYLIAVWITIPITVVLLIFFWFIKSSTSTTINTSQIKTEPAYTTLITKPTPKMYEALPIRTFKNEKYNFTFEYQQLDTSNENGTDGNFSESTVRGEELYKIDQVFCGGSCWQNIIIRIVPKNNIESIYQYRISNLKADYLKETDIISEDYVTNDIFEAKRVVYNSKNPETRDIMFVYNNLGYIITGQDAEYVFYNFKPLTQ